MDSLVRELCHEGLDDVSPLPAYGDRVYPNGVARIAFPPSGKRVHEFEHFVQFRGLPPLRDYPNVLDHLPLTTLRGTELLPG